MAALCVGLAGTVSSVVPAVLLMSVSIFFLYVTGAIYWAIIQDVVHKSRVGGASGFIHLIGSVSRHRGADCHGLYRAVHRQIRQRLYSRRHYRRAWRRAGATGD